MMMYPPPIVCLHEHRLEDALFPYGVGELPQGRILELAARLFGVRLQVRKRHLDTSGILGLQVSAEESIDALAEGFLRH